MTWRVDAGICGNPGARPPGLALCLAALFAFAQRADAAPGRADVAIPDCAWGSAQDFQPCIQAAISESGNHHRTVEIPNGEWALGRALILRADVRLVGESKAAVLRPTRDNRSSPVLLSGTRVLSIQIRDLTFDGGGSDSGNPMPLIAFTASTDVAIGDIVVRHSRGIGVLLQGGMTRSVVRNSVFTDLGNRWRLTRRRGDRIQGLVFCCGANSSNEVTGNEFRDIGLDALQMSNQRGFKAVDNRFLLENDQRALVPSPDYPAAIYLPDSQDGVIADNRIAGAQGNGIDAPGLRNSIITGNIVEDCGGAGIGLFHGVGGPIESAHVTVTNNLLTNNVRWRSGVFKGEITIAGGSPKFITVAGNHAIDNQATKNQDYGLMIVDGTRASHLTVTDNEFQQMGMGSTYGIERK